MDDRAEASIPGMSIIQWVESLKIRGGRNPIKEAANIILFLPSLSDRTPPGSWVSSMVRD